jgi:hypothetical protein
MRTRTRKRTKRTKTAMRSQLLLVAALLLSLVSPGYSAAPPQTRKDYALIFGTVWNAKNEPAYGVPIRIRRANDKKARWDLVSDHRGEFAQRVPTGAQDYIIWADIKTGKGKAKPETKVHVDNDERVDVSLHLTE